YQLMNIALKFYSCVGSNHTTLDAIKDIQKRRPFSKDDFTEIRVFGSQVTVDHVGWDYRPEGLTSAQLNLPFCVATLFIEGDVFVDQFTADCVDNPARIDIGIWSESKLSLKMVMLKVKQESIHEAVNMILQAMRR
ncbi:MAG: hypothetical protein VW907_07705, partial [Opitutae bacterium]